MTAHDWVDLVGGVGLLASVAGAVIACMRANHYERIAAVHEQRANEKAEHEDERAQRVWQDGFREGWQDAQAQRTANDNGGA